MLHEELLTLMKERARELRAGRDCVGSGCASVAAARRELLPICSKKRGRRNTLWHRARVRRSDVQG